MPSALAGEAPGEVGVAARGLEDEGKRQEGPGEGHSGVICTG